MTHATTPRPPWCEGKHGAGGAHSALVGRTADRITVTLLGTVEGPEIGVYGANSAATWIEPRNAGAFADLLGDLGHPDVADLVRTAAASLIDSERCPADGSARLEDDIADPTLELRQAVRDALQASDPTPKQSALITAYFDVTCGDCENGRCHGGSPCGCARHDVSVLWREQDGGEAK